MAGKVFNKMMGLLGLEDEYEDIEELEEEMELEEEKAEVNPPMTASKKQNKVVNIHTATSAKVVISKPTIFEDATDICDDLKNRKIVVVNTTGLEPKTAQRLLDFMGGASYALGGELQEVEKGVYILSPSNVEVTSELKNELTNRGLFGWSK
ncbi:MAG: cell division protein SepF [Clostridiales bacterium]|mgnify:CR=1 FL=1|uniref:cell division protein SepF n=1 Tax=Clostridium sp. N3C TaxID=1776758 RepID=UPI00092E02C9|nr:cell division protein SepF [Clostridium sp. N3C]NLZ47336.1 cell division protein SepF [Clostridiales bacterium]SCN21351.1 Cell division protein SepF [Clostridium sp. N3C]